MKKGKDIRILYNIPSLETVYAARWVYEGYKNACTQLKLPFKPFTSDDDLKTILDNFKPNIFITSLNPYTRKFLNLELLKKYRKKGLVMFNQIPYWKKINNQFAGGDIESDKEYIKLIKSGLAGDIFFNWLEQDDPSMEGFTKKTGYPYHTILMAADITQYYYDYDQNYQADISFVGNYLKDKRDFIKKHLIPLNKKYCVKVYGSDWTLWSRSLGIVQKIGQYFNISSLKKVRKIPLLIDRKVYSSSSINLNIHENHQRKYGTDFNERTFKIIASGGFEICDNVKVLRRYFTEKELVIGKNTKDWFEKIEYYLKYPEKRLPIIKAGKKKVLKYHTYKNRLLQIAKIYKKRRI